MDLFCLPDLCSQSQYFLTMKEARHVATGRIVRASNAVYSDYMGIFECPTCKAALTLRQEYQRASGATIGAAFIHPSGGTEYQRNCPQRIQLTISKESNIDTMPSSKQQFGELLRKNFIQCLKQNCRDGALQYYTRYHSSSTIEVKRLKAFFLLSNKWIKLPQNGKYVPVDQAALIKERISDLEGGDKEVVRARCNKIVWGLEFIVNEKRDSFRKEVLNYIFGHYVFSRGVSLVRMDDNKQIKVLGLSSKTLHASLRVIDKQDLLMDFFFQLYNNNGEFDGSNKEDLRRASVFHDRVFRHLIDYLIDFQWKGLLGV